VQLWTDYTGEQYRSDDIVFNGLDVARNSVVIGGNFSNVTLNNIVVASSSSRPCVMLGSPDNVTIDGFSGTGGYAFLTNYDGDSPSGVTLRNGTYSKSPLIGSNATIDGLAVENVGSGGTTPTTAAPTTSTTEAPTTTITNAPMPPTIAALTTTTTKPTTTTTLPARGALPVVSIKTPTHLGTVAQGLVYTRVATAASARIARTVCYVDGQRVGTDYWSPYRFIWNAGRFAGGSAHTLTVIAYDARGRELGRASNRVEVRN
jgi:hypothetical protein